MTFELATNDPTSFRSTIYRLETHRRTARNPCGVKHFTALRVRREYRDLKEALNNGPQIYSIQRKGHPKRKKDQSLFCVEVIS